MHASNQWSLFTAFGVFTLFAVIAATMNWFGAEAVIVTLLRITTFIALAIVIRFIVVLWIGDDRRRQWQRAQHEPRVIPHAGSAPRAKKELSDVEFVIAAAENGLVSEPNSVIRYLDPPVNDRDIAHLADCAELKWLVLDNTDVSDAGLAFLHGMTKLRRIYVRGSRVTAEGVEQLKAALPDATVLS